ncbi:elongation factor P maturation arginine rhamnosyltransferase EarP [Hydrogenophaga sp.]|uniref:elongation factor P maturation arginine rhamnosyltransferase EarP n=1 Tax=Hydrogenophaga sp. TaxID=1904254 RepID=UPI0025C64C20|nr:elongation factor P maturation arginine rhamnosyltransferase EarP [Hydrogenophaga sp.]
MVSAPYSSLPALRWDLFCRVVDNLGDIGVCWRLSADLAARGQQVRLWIDQPGPLRWMAPGALEGQVPGVQVQHWHDPLSAHALADWVPGDVWVETFGCDPAAECMARLAEQLTQGGPTPVWINLEYLSAEGYVERCHRLPSLVNQDPLRGLTKWFFYPGFTGSTGGLLREPDLLARQAAFHRPAWLQSQQLPLGTARHISLFCYEPPVLGKVMQAAAQEGPGCHWLVTPGRAAQAVAALSKHPASLHPLPALTQHDFDHLLWASDLNCVRGEDSLVRALWAGQPFVWHIYPQHDNAHHAKLDAFLDWLDAPASLRHFHHQWNGMVPAAGPVWPGWGVVDGWRTCVQAARARLLAQDDLSSQLLGFVAKKR